MSQWEYEVVEKIIKILDSRIRGNDKKDEISKTVIPANAGIQ